MTLSSRISPPWVRWRVSRPKSDRRVQREYNEAFPNIRIESNAASQTRTFSPLRNQIRAKQRKHPFLRRSRLLFAAPSAICQYSLTDSHG